MTWCGGVRPPAGVGTKPAICASASVERSALRRVSTMHCPTARGGSADVNVFRSL